MQSRDNEAAAVGITPELLAILVCPVDKAELTVEGSALVCTRCKRRYPVEDGIPNMLVDHEK